MKGILGRKLGMTSVFTKEGKQIPVTVVKVEPNKVMQIKTVENDGYEAIQIGICDVKEKNTNKASIGHAKKASSAPKRFLKEIRNVNINDYTLGSEIKADIFEVGERIDVTGHSKGKGMQGVIKRHNQSRGPMAHGSRFHRRPGSMGTMLPKRVMPGKNLPGHMGDETVTIQNLKVVDINLTDGYILISGNVPGAKNGLVLVKEAVKNVKNDKKATIELVNYETVVDEVIEESTQIEETPVTEEVVEETPVVEETTTEEVKEEVEGSKE